MRTSDRAAHRWLNAPNTQLRRAVSNFYRGDARQSDGTAMPSRAGDSQYPPTPPIHFLFFAPYFLFLRRSHYSYSSEPILLSEARSAFAAVSNRASITMGAIHCVLSGSMSKRAAKAVVEHAVFALQWSAMAVILRRLRTPSVWLLLPIVFMTISFLSERS